MHIKLMYSLIASLFVLQIVSFLFLFNTQSSATKSNNEHSRPKRHTTDSFDTSLRFGDWRKSNISTKLNEERSKDGIKILKLDEERYKEKGMVEIGHSTTIPVTVYNFNILSRVEEIILYN